MGDTDRGAILQFDQIEILAYKELNLLSKYKKQTKKTRLCKRDPPEQPPPIKK